jgi:hypothetical protein
MLIFDICWSKTIQCWERTLYIPLVEIPNSSLCPVKPYINMITLIPAENESCIAILLEPTCIIRKSICFKLTIPLATRLDSLPIVAPGNAFVKNIVLDPLQLESQT